MAGNRIPLVDAAARLGVSYNVAHRLALVGELKASKRGTRWFVDEDSIARARAALQSR